MTPRTFTLWMTAAAALLFVVPQVAFSLHGSSPPRRATATATDVTVPQKPNVVFIGTDDQPYYTMDVMPRTRALIGDKGVTFRNAFVTTPLCCPSRASILTGLFAHNHGVLGNNLPRGGATVFEDSSTVATWLQSAGYRTGYFGKYLNDYASMRPWPYVPPGWSDWRAMKSGCYIRCVLVENGVQVRYRNGSSASYSTHFDNPEGGRVHRGYAGTAPAVRSRRSLRPTQTDDSGRGGRRHVCHAPHARSTVVQ